MATGTISSYLVLLFVVLQSVLAHREVASRTLPETWFHDERSEYSKLFKRDGQDVAQVGSAAWVAAYPSSTPDVSQTPSQWTAALAAAVAAGKIPNIAVSSSTNGAVPTYPNGGDGLSPDICSASYKCRGAGDVWDAPDGVFGVSFDDGPVFEFGDVLYDFLVSQKQLATHFMIGVTILQNPNGFLKAYNNGDDIAVHTYTHPQMTTLSNEDVLAQFGWSMQIIHDSTGGKVPKFWRPPLGDVDNRVRAIAKEVFGLTTVMWNQDPRDWSVHSVGGTNFSTIQSDLAGWISGPKSPGLIILEHELYNETVTAFIDAYPQILAQKWNPVSVLRFALSEVDNAVGQPYWNGPPGTGKVTKDSGILDFGEFSNASSGASTSTSPESSSTTNATSSSSAASSSNSSSGSTSTGSTDTSSTTTTSSSPTALTTSSAALSQTRLISAVITISLLSCVAQTMLSL